MAANLVIRRLDIVQGDGWVKLAEQSTIVQGVLECLSANISIRYREGDAVPLRNNGAYPIDGVDLSELEISTSSLSASGFIVFCQTRI